MIADEINRASPKTQSALLEVMEERHVTVDGARHAVPRPFLVVATQNPIEMDGTYRLPEAQLDRFLMKLSVGYPDEATEVDVLRGAAADRVPESLPAQADPATIAGAIRLAHRVHVADSLYRYAVRLAAATREHPRVRVGVSPRGVDRVDPGRLRVRVDRRARVRAAGGRQGAATSGTRAPADPHPGRGTARYPRR